MSLPGISEATLNSLAPGRCGCNFKIIIFKLIPWTDISCAACKIVVRRIPQNSSDDESTLVQVMAWCRQAKSHYLSQWWESSKMAYMALPCHIFFFSFFFFLLCHILLKCHQMPSDLSRKTLQRTTILRKHDWISYRFMLTHRGWVTHIVCKLRHHCFRKWLLTVWFLFIDP